MSALFRCLLFAAATASSVAFAQASQTWVSGVGDDLNPCSRFAPCLTFAGALAQTAAGGAIHVLDRGDFGPVTIDKAVTIDGNFLQGTISAGTNMPGITVSAGPTDVVRIRGLALNGGGEASVGIDFVSGAMLVIDNCRITQFAGDGIHSANAGMLVVQDSSVAANGMSGIHVTSTGATPAKTLVLRSSLIGNMRGFFGGPLSQSTLVEVQSSQNTLEGVAAESSSQKDAQINLERGSISQNGTGVSASAPEGAATVRLSKSRVFQNTTDVFNEGTGVVASSGNNQLATTQKLPSARTETTVTLTAPESVKLATPVSLSATVTSPGLTPTGRITFREGASVLGEAELVNGAATLELPQLGLGPHQLTAAFAGDEVFAPASGSTTVYAANEDTVRASGDPRGCGCVAAGSAANVALLLLALGVLRRSRRQS